MRGCLFRFDPHLHIYPPGLFFSFQIYFLKNVFSKLKIGVYNLNVRLPLKNVILIT